LDAWCTKLRFLAYRISGYCYSVGKKPGLSFSLWYRVLGYVDAAIYILLFGKSTRFGECLLCYLTRRVFSVIEFCAHIQLGGLLRTAANAVAGYVGFLETTLLVWYTCL